MPTYEYMCRACDHEFERFQKISEKPIRRCPACGERKAERRISTGGGLVFKGPGFYATDYRKGGPKETGGGTKGEPGSKGGKGEKGGGTSGGGGGEGGAEEAGHGDGPAPAGGGRGR